MNIRSFVGLLAFFLVAAASSVRADSLVQVTGNFSCNPGALSCGSLPPVNGIVENFSVSYELDQTTGKLVPGSMSFTSSGNLSPFSAQPITNPMFANWTDWLGDHIQLDFADNEPFNSFPTLGSVGPGEAAFFFLDGNPQFNDSVSVQPVVTPEPVAGLCLVAALPLLFLRRKR